MRFKELLKEYKMPDEVEVGDYVVEFNDTIYNITENPRMFLDALVRSGEYKEDEINTDGDSDYILYDLGIVHNDIHKFIAAEIEEHSLKIRNVEHGISLDNTRIAKMMKQLKKSIVEFEVVSYDENTDNEVYSIISHSQHEFHKKFENKTFFHATSLSNIESILKKGITPTTKTNFDKIVHEDKIFISRNMSSVTFHSHRSNFPVFLEFVVPDGDKIVMDYDIALTYLGTESDTTIKLGYDQVANTAGSMDSYEKIVSLNINGTILKKARQESRINSSYGIYGYTGRIPAKFIKYIHTTDSIINAWIFEENFGDSIEFEISPIEDFEKFTIEQFMERVSDLRQELNDQFEDEDEDEDEDE